MQFQQLQQFAAVLMAIWSADRTIRNSEASQASCNLTVNP